MIKLNFLLIIVLFMISCTKDRKIEKNNNKDNNDTTNNVEFPSLKINEFLAKGSVNLNEFGTASDWVEIYNPTNEDVSFEAGKWYFTDDFSNPTQFELPNKIISANGFLLIWCDNTTGGNDIHAPFKLSSSGESIGLYYKDSLNDTYIVDTLSFGVQTVDGQSTGRYPDGSNAWTTFSNPTPDQSNN